MIRKKKKQFFLARLIERVSLIPERLKKEKTRIKLRRRGSFENSSWTSLALRPILEISRIRSFFAAPLVAAVVAGSTMVPLIDPAAALFDQPAEVLAVSIDPATSLTTQEGGFYFSPVTNLTGVSQLFHAGHPGVDIRSPLGSAVVAIEKGVVASVDYQRFGYGTHIRVDHGRGLESMYAHLGRAIVHEGDEVTAGQVIGVIGMTGRTTGPHLHIEVTLKNQPENPMRYFGKAIKDQATADLATSN
jgi:murein DD-endopeptidase MepM/ murein hydrolase activator NlpD